MSWGQDLNDSLYAFITIQKINTICTGTDVKEALLFLGVIGAFVSLDFATVSKTPWKSNIPRPSEFVYNVKTYFSTRSQFGSHFTESQKLQVYADGLATRSRGLRKLGLLGMAISLATIVFAASVESQTMGELWNSLETTLRPDTLVLDIFSNPVADGTLIGNFVSDPKAFLNIFLDLTPEQAEMFLRDSVQLRALTIEYGRAVETFSDRLAEMSLDSQNQDCHELINSLTELQQNQY